MLSLNEDGCVRNYEVCVRIDGAIVDLSFMSKRWKPVINPKIAYKMCDILEVNHGEKKQSVYCEFSFVIFSKACTYPLKADDIVGDFKRWQPHPPVCPLLY